MRTPLDKEIHDEAKNQKLQLEIVAKTPHCPMQEGRGLVLDKCISEHTVFTIAKWGATTRRMRGEVVAASVLLYLAITLCAVRRWPVASAA
jgi:hypothetical protein